MDENIRLLTQATYNKLSEEAAHAAYMWKHTGGSAYHESVWDKCWWDMRELEESVHKEGYEFIETGTKVNGKIQSSIYTLVEMSEYAKRLVNKMSKEPFLL